jgi:hypothetical protein
MTTSIRSAIPALVFAGLSLLLAVATGVEWLGKPLKLVHLLTIIGLSMTAGVSWMRAVWLAKQERPANSR